MDDAIAPFATASIRRGDPVVTEIVRNCLIAAIEEMKTDLNAEERLIVALTGPSCS